LAGHAAQARSTILMLWPTIRPGDSGEIDHARSRPAPPAAKPHRPLAAPPLGQRGLDAGKVRAIHRIAQQRQDGPAHNRIAAGAAHRQEGIIGEGHAVAFLRMFGDDRRQGGAACGLRQHADDLPVRCRLVSSAMSHAVGHRLVPGCALVRETDPARVLPENSGKNNRFQLRGMPPSKV